MALSRTISEILQLKSNFWQSTVKILLS